MRIAAARRLYQAAGARYDRAQPNWVGRVVRDLVLRVGSHFPETEDCAMCALRTGIVRPICHWLAVSLLLSSLAAPPAAQGAAQGAGERQQQAPPGRVG